ncbi:Fatty acid synthase [Ooceraea biroi]|uniref:Fatty acid synthase n=1 Tax=Ooceraea biroi TaxID=2015173 RepID=A0A026WNV9_OOCBI|nr:Fatty acid synthase [Ooceraea biroi]
MPVPKSKFPKLASTPGEEIVISGIAGRYPDSDNVELLKNNLFNKVDLVTDDDRRWRFDHAEIPQRLGKINNVGKFDALFFGVHFKQAHTLDPMCRMLLEHAYEAVIDAGINPRQLRGSRTGVFIGTCFSESEKTWFYEKLQVNGFGITGCSRAMLANRISYWLGIHGPSYTLDSACSSSLYALENAYRSILDGQCDSAIVGGSNLCLHPYVSLQYSRLGVLSSDGTCKCFDASANGYVRSEAICVLFLQKAKDAKRIYSTVVHSKTNCDGFKEQGITFPSSVMQSALLRDCYEESGMSPSSVSYVECHATGTKVGDPEELNTIENIFVKDRTTPLLIGSVKSNIGHTEPVSGLCQITKVVIAMETGTIPPNLHYKTPLKGMKSLEDGRLKVVTDTTPWEGGYVGINSFGFGGANCHVILKSHTKAKINNGAKTDDLPRLVVVSGRTEESVKVFLNDVERHANDVEYVRLLHDIHADDIQGHLYRGHTIIGSKTAEKPIRQIDNFSGTTRPIWFVFSGMGSQWPGMGIELMRFPVFAQAIQKCDAVLRPRGVDLMNILTNKDKSMFDNILNSFVGIAAVQIGLVDLLTSIGIVPDNIIGHSVGELGCAYADGCFTAEQMILSAYSRGLASIESELIFGSMAAIGLGYEDIKNMCPSDIEVACHNAADSSTISGPAESLKKFVAQLQANKVFAKEVNCSNIAYHSRYIAPAGPKLLTYLTEVIPEPKPRSRKWVSTSVPRNKWFTASAKLSSAEYHTNNLLSPVLFEETARMIPKDAVTIEIAPHGLLQAILRRSLGSGVTNIPLTQRGHKDNAEVFLQAIGKLYNTGLQPDIAKLYPPIEYPVSRGTPMISPSIRWEHSDDWYVTSFKTQKKVTSGERIVTISPKNEDHVYMTNHVLDGKNLIPAVAYLGMVWETMALLQAEAHTNLSVVFEDLTFMRATHFPKEGETQLTVMVQKGTGKFEVSEDDIAIVSGLIRVTPNPPSEKVSPALLPEDTDEEEVMNTEDIYKEFRLRGYQYAGPFCSLKSTSISMTKGHLAWTGNWVTFIDGMLQLMLLGMDTRDLYLVTRIQKIVIDTKLHQQEVQKLHSVDRQLPVRVYKDWNIAMSGGVEIRALVSTAIPRQLMHADPILENHKFVAHRDGAQVSLQEAMRLSTHIALECLQTAHMKAIELIDNSDKVAVNELASPILIEILNDTPIVQANVCLASNRFAMGELPSDLTRVDIRRVSKDAALVVGIELLTKSKNDQLQQVVSILRNGGFVLTREKSPKPDNLSALSKYHLDIILEKSTGKENIILLKKKEMIRKTEVVYIKNNEFSWLKKLNSVMNAESKNTENVRILLVGEGDYECGLLGFVNSLRREPGGEIIRSVLIQDSKAPAFSPQNSFYSEQIQLDLPINVLRPGKVWGSYRQLPLPSQKAKPVQHAFVKQLVRNDLSSLNWVEGPIRPSNNQQGLVNIVYSSLNFKDIMLTTGKLIVNSNERRDRFDEIAIGLDFAGVDAAGRRVMGICENRGMANVIVADKDLCWYVPDNWSLEDAATVPCVYATCYYALYINGEMKKDHKVLIHSGAGGIGQAAIHLALHEGCEVFTTVGTPEKRKFIREKFPSIPDDHIGNSNDTSFEQMILQRTQGQGVNLILNSLAEEKLQASVRCVTKNGRFLEIGKFDLAQNNVLGMMVFLKEISFHGIILDNVHSYPQEKMELSNLLAEGLKSGAVKPLVRTVFEREELTTAFRYMTTRKHVGKIILKICDEKNIGKPVLALPRYYCDSKKSYLLLGGLGGVGLELADWLILRGARNLVLTSRTGVKTGYQRSRIDRWKSYGVNVLIVTGADASNHKDCEFILKSAEKQAPVDAIFNLIASLRDNILKNQTAESFEQSFKEKAWSTKRMDELSRKLCPQLRHFVAFSSLFCSRGNPGQTNYNMANSVMERICEERVADGLPGLAIEFGTIDEVGIVNNMQASNKELIINGVQQQRISSCLEKLEEFLLQDQTVVSSMVVAKKDTSTCATMLYTLFSLSFAAVRDIQTVSQHTSLAELGMDSIMSVEIKQSLERDFDMFLTARDIRNLTFAKLAEMRSKDVEETQEQGKGQETEVFDMHLLIRKVNDENITPEVCMELPTRKDSRKVDVFLLPGIEGCGHIFNALAPKIRPRVTCLQYGANNIKSTLTSIPEYADYLLQYVLPIAKQKRMFSLVGYSYGALIALELAKRLEDHNLNGRLVLIDGAPQLLKAMIEQFMPSSTQEELQNNVLLSIMDMLQPGVSGKLLLALEKCANWEKKLDSFISHIPRDSVPLSVENQRALCTTIYRHVVALKNYDPSALQLRTPITLLKPTKPSVPLALEEDYGLRKITRDKVEVHYIEGNHVTMVDSDTVVTVIGGDPIEDPKLFKKLILEDRPLEEEDHEERTRT